ncbi:hypothetical protein [Cupriavidus sp. UYPR2.512]|uniref:hypothetical protein n=1 Tax=Cupriavidus sp. UYPR2.512 TaxID=1080187 RepID=UPI0012FC4BC6|nr:hypothetical protein [Cupriavidus sp. UYPR2.512]UIF89966.1 hypothetical protein KAF44_39990 [Cupriavidus necator]
MVPEVLRGKVFHMMFRSGTLLDVPSRPSAPSWSGLSDAQTSNRSDRERQHWHANLLKQRLVHQSGLVLLVRGDDFVIGPLPMHYPAAKLVALHEEARALYRALAQRWTPTALHALGDRLHAIAVASARGALCLQRSLDAQGNLLHCCIAGTELPPTEVAEIFGDCTTFGVLQRSRTQEPLHGPVCQAAAADIEVPVPPMRRAQIAGFQPVDGLDAFTVNFAALAQLAARGRAVGCPRPC